MPPREPGGFGYAIQTYLVLQINNPREPYATEGLGQFMADLSASQDRQMSWDLVRIEVLDVRQGQRLPEALDRIEPRSAWLS